MAISIKHKKTSAKPDSSDDSLILPSDWNDTHDIQMGAFTLLGNPTAAEADAVEITLGDGLAFDDGLKIKLGSGLEFDETTGALNVTGGVEVGTVANFPFTTAPLGWLAFNGQTVPTMYPELRQKLIDNGWPWMSAGDPYLPDLITNGEFVRSGGPGGLVIGTMQLDTVGPHNHPARASASGYTGGSASLQYAPGDNNGTVLVPGGGAINGVQNNTGTTETRPRNIALLPCIKAFGAVSINGAADLAELLNAIATKAQAEAGTNNTQLMTPLTTRWASAAYNRWETVPNGLIFPVAQTFVAFPDLAPFIELRITTTLQKAGAVGNIWIQWSIDNGVSWITTPTYSYVFLGTANGGAPGAGSGTVQGLLASIQLAGAEKSKSTTVIGSFNKAEVSMAESTSAAVQPGTLRRDDITCRDASGVPQAFNAIRVIASDSAALTGLIHVEGIRG